MERRLSTDDYMSLEDKQHALQSKPTIQQRICRFFQVYERNSTLWTEIRAGCVLFATMCYIVVLNPSVLSAAHLQKSRVAASTIFVATVGSSIMGLAANLPLGIAPGMGLNTYFAYDLVAKKGFTVDQALAVCFVAGTILLLLGLTNCCTYLTNIIPLSLKKALVMGIGLFQTIIGLYSIGVIQSGTSTALEVGTHLGTAEQLMAASTLLLMAMLILLEVPGAFLIGIVVSVAVSLASGLTPFPPRCFGSAPVNLQNLDFSVVLRREGFISVLLVLFVVFVDVGGVILGCTAQAPELYNSKGTVKNTSVAFTTVGASIMLSSCLGTSPTIIFLESAAAIQQGGRTGLTAITNGVLFAFSFFFIPLLAIVPQSVTTSVLVLIGSFMMGAAKGVAWEKINHALPAFVTISAISFTCSISDGLTSGLLFYMLLNTPFLIAKIFNWTWLKERLVIDELVGTPFEKAHGLEQEIETERRQSSIFMFKVDDELLRKASIDFDIPYTRDCNSRSYLIT